MVIDNPLYVPVRCGAALDENDEGNVIMGDNTGEDVYKRQGSNIHLQCLGQDYVNDRQYGACSK